MYIYMIHIYIYIYIHISQVPKQPVNVNIILLTKFIVFWLRRVPFTSCWARICGAILIFISRMCLHC